MDLIDWTVSPPKVYSVEDIAPDRISDRGELNSLPFLFKVAIVAAAIMAGKTRADARAAVRQAFDVVKAQG